MVMRSVVCEVWCSVLVLVLSYSAGPLNGGVSVTKHVSDVSEDLLSVYFECTASSMLTTGAISTVCPVGTPGRFVSSLCPEKVVRSGTAFEPNLPKHNSPLANGVC